MKRFALIVKGSVEERIDDPPGITADVNNLVDWLRSNEGGAWELEEIYPLRSPTWENLRDTYLPVASSADYSLLAFFGHGRGATDNKNEMLLRINKEQEISLSDFSASTRRSLRLIDGCRQVVPEEFLEGVTKTAAAPQIRMDILRGKHRDLFDSAIEKSGAGVVTLYSTAPGMNAYGTLNGGRFTSSVISAAQIWTMIGYHPPRVMEIEEVFKEADHLTRRLEPAQSPDFKGTDGAGGFPFAVITR